MLLRDPPGAVLACLVDTIRHPSFVCLRRDEVRVGLALVTLHFLVLYSGIYPVVFLAHIRRGHLGCMHIVYM